MGKFGFSKKKGDGDEDGNRSALFGSRSKNKNAAVSTNPYAQPPPSSDPYALSKPPANGYGSMSKSNSQLDSMPKSKYGGMEKESGPPMGGGYAPGKQGDQGAYGRDRYGGNDSPASGGGSRYGAGGYGGLGRTDPNDPGAADDRDALFGGARQRNQDRPNPGSAPPPYQPQAPGAEDGLGGAPPGPTYGTYQDRQLTAEEEEEEDVQAVKQDIRFMKQQDVSSTRNALRVAAQAEESGRDALTRLGAQGERIHNTERNLDLANNQNRVAEEKARELKRLNKSMFAMQVSNPFTGDKRRRARDEAIHDRHQQERLQREETRLAAFRTEQRMDQAFKDINKGSANPKSKTNLAERSKYQFEQDSEDDEMENEIESNLTALHGAATRLNGLAKATGKELDIQDPHVRRTMEKVFYPPCFIYLLSYCC